SVDRVLRDGARRPRLPSHLVRRPGGRRQLGQRAREHRDLRGGDRGKERRAQPPATRVPPSRTPRAKPRGRRPLPRVPGARGDHGPRSARGVSEVRRAILRCLLRRPRRDEARAGALSVGLLAERDARGSGRTAAVRAEVILAGQCHCGDVALRFETAVPPECLPVRACGCSFCRKHGARATWDPKGRVEIILRAPGSAVRYRFALRTADFLVCARCGIYVAAVLADGAGSYATVNVNVLDRAAEFRRAGTPVSYDGENE